MTADSATTAALTRSAFTRSGMTLREAAALFARHPNSRVLTATTATAAATRLLLGKWSRRDAVAAGAILAAEPFVEWMVHVHVLHRRPREKQDGSIADSLLASSHRAHHSDPRDPGLVFIPRPALAPSIAALACCPKWCTLDALPKWSRVARTTASRTSGASGVVAL